MTLNARFESLSPSRLGRAEGFSLLELMTVVGAGIVLTSIAVMSVHGSLPMIRADSALRTVKGAMIYARDQAMTERRSMEVQFIAPNEVRVSRVNLDGTTTELRRTFTEGSMTFQTYAGMPDTPDAFGNATAITFPANRVRFTSEGTAVDANGWPVNGSVFLGRLTSTLTARAATLFGATGRVAAYRWDGRVWKQM